MPAAEMPEMPEMPRRSSEQEAWNAATHGVAFLLSVFGAWWLWFSVPQELRGSGFACAVYLASMVLLYGASTLSHLAWTPSWKHWFRAVDQGAIYLLIAGTYTPFMWVYLDGAVRLGCLGAMWAAAVVGFCFKVFAHHQVNAMSVRSYLLLGWLPSLPLHSYVSWPCLAWMALGGVFYTAGTVFLRFDRRVKHFHAVWHVCTILGSACHFYAIYAYVLYNPYQA